MWGRDTKAFPVTFDPTPIDLGGALISQGHLYNIGWALAIVCTVTLVLLLLVRNMMYDSLHTGAGKFVGTTESTIHSRETLEQPKENRSR